MPLPYVLDEEALKGLPEELQLEARARFAMVQRGQERNPLWGYIPHAKQQAYHAITAPVGAFVGGNRSGKSYGGTADDIIQVVDVEAVPPHLQAFKRWEEECHWRVITPKLQTTLKRVVLPLFKKLIPKDQLWKGSWDKAYNGEERLLQLANGNTIDFLTHDMELDAFSGVELHGFRLDEEPKGVKGKAIFDESIMRLLSTGGDARMTFTPLFGLSWAYYELTARTMTETGPGERAPRWDDDVQVVTVDMDENPHLDERSKRVALRRIPAAQRKARKSGQFIHFAGRIYPEWDPDLHVIPWQPIPRDQAGKPSVEIFSWIDPGIDHPTSVGWFWIDFEHPEGRAVVFDTIKVRDKNVAEVCELIHEKETELAIKPKWRVIDPSARNKQHVTGRSLQDEYARHGVHTRPGTNSRLAGFSRVSELLKATVKHEADEEHPTEWVEIRPRLVVMANNSNDDDELPGLIEEFPLYRWRPRSNAAVEGPSPQEPIKVKDDHLDGLRYGVMSNPTGLKGDEDLDLPPADGIAYDEWERRNLVKDHIKRLISTRKKRRTGRRNLAGSVLKR